MPGRKRFSTLILMTFPLLSTACCATSRTSVVEQPRPVVVQPTPTPCKDPGPRPTPPEELHGRTSVDRIYVYVTVDIFKAIGAYFVAADRWEKDAETCIAAQRRAAGVTP